MPTTPDNAKAAPFRSEPEHWWSSPVVVTSGAGGIRVQIAWRRLIAMVVVVLLAGWLATAGGLYLWVRYRRGFDRAVFTDILLPNRWKHYAVSRGNFYIDQAKRELEQKKWSDAIYHLRVGVGASPTNLEGRMLLVKVFGWYNSIDLQKRVLLDGIQYSANDPKYLRFVFEFLLANQEDAEVIRIATELLPGAPQVNERNQLIALAAAEAHAFRGNFAAAEKLIGDYSLHRMLSGRILQAQVDWDCGRTEAAVNRLKTCLREKSDDDDSYALLGAYLQQLGRFDDAARYAWLRQLANPGNFRARLEMLRTVRRKGDSSEFHREIDQFLVDFARDQVALLTLGDFAVQIQDPALARRVFDHCTTINLSTGLAALSVAEAYVASGQFRAALDFVQQLNSSNPEWFRRLQPILSAWQAVACYGLGQKADGELYLDSLLAERAGGAEFLILRRSDFLLTVGTRLQKVGAVDEARRVLAAALAADPRNQATLTKLVEVDLALGRAEDLPANLRLLLTMRRPNLAVLETAATKLGGDRYLFAADRDDLLDSLAAAIAAAPPSERLRSPVETRIGG